MLKLGPQSKESANFFNKSWVIDGTMILEEYLGATDGAARSPRLFARRRQQPLLYLGQPKPKTCALSSSDVRTCEIEFGFWLGGSNFCCEL